MILRMLFALVVSTIVLQHAVSAQELPIATEATTTKPLEKGVKVPDVKLTGLNGETVSLASLHQEKPVSPDSVESTRASIEKGSI